MALVRMTESLRGEVRVAINNLYQPKYDKAMKSFNNDWGGRAYTSLMEPYAAGLTSVKSDFLNTIETFNIKGVVGVVEFRHPPAFRIVSSPWPVRNTLSVFAGSLHNMDYRGWQLANNRAVFGSLIDEMEAYGKRCDDVMREWDNAKTTLMAMLDQCTTLAEALTKWPALWELLPQHYKDRHAAPTVRGQKILAPALDLSALDNMAADFARKRLEGKK